MLTLTGFVVAGALRFFLVAFLGWGVAVSTAAGGSAESAAWAMYPDAADSNAWEDWKDVETELLSLALPEQLIEIQMFAVVD